jgi:hypothetical protein
MGKEYMVVYAETPHGLSEKVSAALALNWYPKGGVAVTTMPMVVGGEGRYINAISFYQAMVREGGPPIIIPTSALYT